MSYYDDASLVVIPSGYKTSKVYAEKPTDGSGDLTFTRTGDTATRVNSAGLIEKVRTNLITYSEDLSNAAYTNEPTDGSLTITANYGVAPDGTNTADRVQITKGTSYSQIFQAKSVTAGIEYSFSLYLKSLSGTPTVTILYNENGAVGKATLTSSWVRYTFTYNAPLTSTNYPMIALYGGDSASCDILAWGLQFETGVATAYIPTTTAAVSVGPVSNVPRLDYLGNTCPRLILEGQRTNIKTSSENATGWGNPINITTSLNVATSPDGYVNADKIIETATTSNHRFDVDFSATSGTAYTFSYFAKAAERTQCHIHGYSDNGVFSISTAIFNLSNGTIVSNTGGGAASIVDYGNGWYRVSLTLTAGATALGYWGFGVALNGATNYLGVATNGALFYGIQLESGAYATSYIPTLAASATRGADACSKTGISSLIGQTEGTLYAEIVLSNTNQSTNRLLSIVGTTGAGWSDNSLRVDWNTNGTLSYDAAVGGATSFGATSASTYTAGQTIKVAVAYKSNDTVMYVNGVQEAVDASTGAMPACSLFALNELYGFSGGSFELHNWKQALLFKTRLTNAEMQELTTL